jgi:hypothetical protein
MLARRAFAALFVACTLILAGPAAAAKTAVARDGWPETPAGAMGRKWVAAFAAGDSAMRAFQQKKLSPESLAKRSPEERAASYRKLRDQYGVLALASVVKSTPEELTVKLLDSDAKSHEFIFKVKPGSPARLESISIRQSHFGHGGGGGHGE